MTVTIGSGSGALDVTRGERAIVVGIERAGQGDGRSSEARLEEAVGLAEAIGIAVVDSRTFRLRSPKPATLLGKGQIEQLAEAASDKDAGLLVVDAALTPVQQKSLEEQVGAKVIDRTSLILEIFGERAATAEGRLQVELAHLDYQAGRLVRSWTHLERQRGGFGFLGGPGETQIEADRRLIRDRMARIRRELEQWRPVALATAFEDMPEWGAGWRCVEVEGDGVVEVLADVLQRDLVHGRDREAITLLEHAAVAGADRGQMAVLGREHVTRITAGGQGAVLAGLAVTGVVEGVGGADAVILVQVPDQRPAGDAHARRPPPRRAPAGCGSPARWSRG